MIQNRCVSKGGLPRQGVYPSSKLGEPLGSLMEAPAVAMGIADIHLLGPHEESHPNLRSHCLREARVTNGGLKSASSGLLQKTAQCQAPL